MIKKVKRFFHKKNIAHKKTSHVNEEGHSSKSKQERIEKELRGIYENSDGSMPDMTQFELRRRGSWLSTTLLLLFSLIFLGGSVFAAFWMLDSNSKFIENDVILSVSGEEELSIGQEVQYRVRYRNAQSTPLNNAELNIKFPEGFVYDKASVDPINQEKTKWSIGTIQKDGSGYIDIFGKIYGNIGEEKSLRVFLNYKPENFSSEFQAVSHVEARMTKSPLSISVELPESVAAQADIPLVIKIDRSENFAALPEKMVVELLTPENFVYKSADPKSESKNSGLWTITSIPTTLNVKGTVTSDGKINIGARIIGTVSSNQKFVFGEYNLEREVTKTDIMSSLVINGATSELSVSPGEKLLSNIKLQNSGQTPLEDVKIRFIIEAPSYKKQSILNWSELDDVNDGIVSGEQLSDTVRKGEIIWTSKQIKELQKIEAGKDVTVEFIVPVKDNSIVDLTSFVSHAFTGRVDIQYSLAGSVKTISSNVISGVVSSDLVFKTDYSIGSDNNFNLNWTIENSFHELKEVTVKTEFFGSVELPDKFTPPAGNVNFDKEKKTLVWKIDSIPLQLDVLSLEFPVTLLKKNPSQSQLSGKITLEATDVVTGQKIIKIADPIQL